MKIFWIAAGGAIGSVLRYGISTSTHRLFNNINFPWGTLMVNATGSLLIGFLWGLSEANLISAPMRIFLFIGLLGGYTTFSSFSLETMNLIRSGEIASAC
jgi:CrcB protein